MAAPIPVLSDGVVLLRPPREEDLPDVLAKICADTLAEVERRKAVWTVDDLRAAIDAAGDPTRGFGRYLKEEAARGRPALIAEIKKASPSGGLIRPDFDPADIATLWLSLNHQVMISARRKPLNEHGNRNPIRPART